MAFLSRKGNIAHRSLDESLATFEQNFSSIYCKTTNKL